MCAARVASRLDLCDYVPESRHVVERWLAGDERDFDWTPYIARTLFHESGREPAPEEVAARASRVRSLVRGVLAPGGTLMLASIREARFSDFGETRYPYVCLTPADLPRAFETCGFDRSLRKQRWTAPMYPFLITGALSSMVSTTTASI